MTSTATFTVTGMTCEHCVSSVSEEVLEIAGVTVVDVDLATGGVTVTSDQPAHRRRGRGGRRRGRLPAWHDMPDKPRSASSSTSAG